MAVFNKKRLSLVELFTVKIVNFTYKEILATKRNTTF